jgi:hypothetical protein
LTAAEVLARAKGVEAQYVRLIQDYPESEYAKQAQAALNELRREIAQEEIRQKARPEIEAIVHKVNDSLEEKDADAFFALLTPSARGRLGREYVTTLFKDPQFTAFRFTVSGVRFNADNTRAEVETDAALVDSPKEKPRRTAFDLAKTAEGWKIERGGDGRGGQIQAK